MKKNFNRKVELIIIILMVVLLSVVFQFFIIHKLPAKYFYDSNNILSITNGIIDKYYDKSYIFAGNFFKFINIFKFTTFDQWAFFITAIGILFLLLYLSKFNHIELHKLFFIASIIVFLNIYVFRISKDFIQWFFWFLVLFGISINKPKIRALYLLALFIFEALMFRIYYIAIYIGYLGIINIIKMLLNNRKSINYVKMIFIIFLGVFVSLLLIQKIYPSIYYRVVSVRTMTNSNRIDSLDAITIITDIFNSNNVFLYIINFILNYVRILFPIELIMKGIKYIPFIFFQIYLTINTINSIKMIDKNSEDKLKFLVSMFISFILVSSVFEPDFGSAIRHEITTTPIFLSILLYNNRKVDNINQKNERR